MKATLSAVAVALAPLATLSAPGPIRSIFTSEYSPRRALYMAHPGLLWTNVISDAGIALSYLLFFFGITWLDRKLRHIDSMRPQLWVLSALNIFVLSCEAMVLLRMITIWYPLVQISIGLKIICAIASLPTSLIFVLRAPEISSSISRFFSLLASEQCHVEALRQSEALLDRTNRIAGIGGWELDLTTSEVIWSAETARMHGLPAGYRPTLEESINYYAPEFHAKIRDALQKATSNGGGWDLELPLIRTDGRRIWVRLVGEAEIVDGKAVRLFGSIQDKTREIEQREALRNNELLLDRANRVSGMGVWELDLVTNEVTWSAQAAEIHGVRPGYRPTLEEGITYFVAEGQPTLHELMQKAMKGGGGWDVELTLIRADGGRRQVRHLGDVEFLDERPVKLFGSIQDITRETEQREALRKARLFLDRTNQVAGIGGWEFDLLTRDLIWSDQTARIHGMPPGHKPTYEESLTYFPVEYHASITAAVESAVSTGNGYELELPLIRPDGQRVWVRLMGEIEAVDGKAVRIFGSLQDKTLEVEQREALRKSQLFLDRTNSIAGVGGWEVDIAAETVTWSTETYRIHALPTTYTPTVAAGISFYAEHHRAIIAEAVEQALETGEAWDLELKFIRADDRPIWVRTTGNVEIENGSPSRFVGAIQDKTAQVEARIALQRANERITLAMEGGGIGIWDWNIASNRFICDAWMFRMHGLEYIEGPTEMATWTGRLHPEDRPVTVARLLDALEGNSDYRTEFRVIWDDGSTHILQASGEVFRDQSGQPLRMIGIHRDVTESRRLASELRQQHELLSVTLFSIGDAVISVDALRNILWMNGAAERMTGWESTDAIGMPVAEALTILHEDSRQPAAVYVDPAIPRSRRVSINDHVVLVARDGTERSVESCATPIYDIRAELTGSVIVVSDVTEQVRHAEEVEHVNKLQSDLKLKDEFLSHVSHELRSPLTSVYSFASIIADNLAGDTTDEQQQFLQIILKNVLQLQSMIEDLLTVTQSKEGRLPIDLQPVAVAPAILDAIHTAHPAAAARQISISSSNLEELPEAWSDPTRLRQIMIILLDNAVKFTPEGGMVAVRVFEEEKMLHFEVEDNGIGIALEKRARVFEKLYQITAEGHADTSQQGRIGLGLGLHIARDLVRRQGGNIWVTGAPEQGSIFNFTLPIASSVEDHGVTPLRRKTDWPESVDKQLNPAA